MDSWSYRGSAWEGSEPRNLLFLNYTSGYTWGRVVTPACIALAETPATSAWSFYRMSDSLPIDLKRICLCECFVNRPQDISLFLEITACLFSLSFPAHTTIWKSPVLLKVVLYATFPFTIAFLTMSSFLWVYDLTPTLHTHRFYVDHLSFSTFHSGQRIHKEKGSVFYQVLLFWFFKIWTSDANA